jgi:beta-1,4-N-acetylglucosaminyltransferase
MPGRVFVTVGSTRFPGLVKAVLSPETIKVLQDLGYGELRIQYGTDEPLFLDQTQGWQNNLSVTGFDYSSSIEKEMQQADMIISHAGICPVNLFDNEGSGSVLEALHLQKLLIVIPNAALMDNHQVDVAKALSDQGYLLQSSLEYAFLCLITYYVGIYQRCSLD